MVLVYVAAFFQIGHPIYSAKYIRIRLGYAIEKPTTDCESPKKEYVWSYESPKFIMEQVLSCSPLVHLDESFVKQILCRLYIWYFETSVVISGLVFVWLCSSLQHDKIL